MANKRFPDNIITKPQPTVNDILLLADAEASNAPAKTTIQTLVTLVETEVGISDKADKTNVLEISNSQVTSFDPQETYHPTTKLYVDTRDTVVLAAAQVYADNAVAVHTVDLHALSGTHNADVATLSGAIDDHLIDVSNPHVVTASQVGALTDIVNDTTPTLGGNLSGAGYVVSDIELKDYSETLISATSSEGVLTLDMSLGNVFHTVLFENITSVVITNPPVSGKAGSITLEITQDPTTPRTVVFGASYLWNEGTAPTMSPGLDAIDFYTLTTFDGGTNIFGFTAGQAMA